MASERGGADHEVVVLDRETEPSDEPTTVERGPNLPLLWIVAAGIGLVVLFGIVGALLDRDSDDAPPAADDDPGAGATDAPSETPLDDPAADEDDGDEGGDEQPTLRRITPIPGFGAPLGTPLPDAVPAFDAPDDLVLVGHSPGGRLAAVRADGSVTELLAPGGGPGFLPQASTARAVIGLMNQGGGTLVVDATGASAAYLADDRDAPVYYPLHDQSGYVVHGSWLGKVTYIGHDGQVTGEGPDLARGTRVLADTAEGLVVVTLDGAARVVDRVTGDLVTLLPSVPLAVAGEHQVTVACPQASTCQVEVRTLGGVTTTVLPVDPEIAHRLIIAISPDGRQVAFRSLGRVEVVGVDGSPGPTFEVDEADGVRWLGDTVLVVEDDELQLWSPGAAEPQRLQIGEAIDPTVRGIAMLRAPQAG